MNIKYISHFFSLNCARDIIPFFTSGSKKTAAKEVTESFGMYVNAQEQFNTDFKDWVIVSVGDGKRPRTGSVFRFVTKCHKVYSVDPEADLNWFEKTLPELFQVVPRDFTVYPKKAADVKIDCEGKKTLLVLCHSHCPMKEAVNCLTNYSNLSMISMPCCQSIDASYLDKEFLSGRKFSLFRDKEVWSPKNLIYCWDRI